MPSTPQSQSKSGLTKTGRASMRPDDAASLLMGDHRAVEKLFKQYDRAKENVGQKQKIATQIIQELKTHTQLEEEIFYPACREFVEEDMVDEAVVEHASAKDLMAQIEGMDPSDELYDAKVTVLREMIEHHVEEEENELFPACRRSKMDLKGLGEQIQGRKTALMGGRATRRPLQ